MATANKALKKRAKDFAETHGLSYLSALKAVDEPLHELRTFSAFPAQRYTALYPHFRLIGEESIYSSAYPELSYDFGNPAYLSTIKAAGLSHFDGTRDLLREIGRRLQLLEDAGAENIWEYRVLQRGGLLGADAPALEPFLHHYGARIGAGMDTIFLEGDRLGIFGVSIARHTDIQDRFTLLPITEDQLSALIEGRPAGELNLPRYHTNGDGGSFFEKWSSSYSLLATSVDPLYGRATDRSQLNSLRIFLSQYPDDLQGFFDGLGLRSKDFVLRDVTGVVFTFTLDGDIITLEEEGRPGYPYSRSSYGVLEL